jgi:YYY domain-containing protein
MVVSMQNLAQAVSLNWLTWLLTVEVLGLAALPLAAFLFRSLPDRGYAFAKPLGLLAVGFLNWWLGSIVPYGNEPWLLWLLVIALAAVGLLLYARQVLPRPADPGPLLKLVAIEEGLFLVAFLVWTAVRSYRPDIFSTEKPMDFMLLQVSGATHSFPPPDAWLAGKTVNYYYLGYAIFGMLGRMAGVDPRYGFNLANITIFALGCTGGYGLAQALTRRWQWGLAGAFSVMLAGDLDGLAQVASQVAGGNLNARGLNLWCSTRVIGGCADYHSITEFPIFSVIWNDLHPHVMAIPFVLLALAFGLQALFESPGALPQAGLRVLWLGMASATVGALFAINSWDYPVYTVFLVGALLLAAWRDSPMPLVRVLEAAAVVPASLVLVLPYLLTVHSKTGFGLHLNPTSLGDVLTVIGGLMIPSLLFVLWQGGRALAEVAAWQPAQAQAEEDQPEPIPPLTVEVLRRLPIGGGWWLVLATLLLFFVWPARVDMLYVVLIAACLYALLTRRRGAEPAIQAGLLLAILGTAVLLASDVGYLRDNFDGTANYRMNTMFKLFYQAWILLAVAAPVAVFAVGAAVRRWRGRGAAWAWYVAAALVASSMAVYPLEGIPSQGDTAAAGRPGLDGLAYVRDTAPDLYAAVGWISRHTRQFDVVAEGFGSDYWVQGLQADANVISALTGRPTIIGWPGSHEALWQGDYGSGAASSAAAALITQREQDTQTLFSTNDEKAALSVLIKYHVAYLFVGPFERATYASAKGKGPGLTNFRAFLTPVLQLSTVTIYKVPCLGTCLTH